MRNRLLEADKLAALGEIAAGVAHEIRNPLVSIGGFTRRIRKKVGDDSPITAYLDVIIEEVSPPGAHPQRDAGLFLGRPRALRGARPQRDHRPVPGPAGA